MPNKSGDIVHHDRLFGDSWQSKAEEVVIYGHEDDRDMAAAAAKAVVWGFQKVYYLDDGLDGWRNAGYPVEKNN